MPDDPSPDRARRIFLMRALTACTGAGLASLAAGCGAPEGDHATQPDGSVQTPTGKEPKPGLSREMTDCRPTESLSQQSLDVRQALDYTPETPVPGERCDNCRFYVSPEGESGPEGTCGGCDHFAGPVAAGGWCTVWDVRGA